MAKVKATPVQCKTLYNARLLVNAERKGVKKTVFAEIRKDHGLQGVGKLGIRSLVDKNNANTYGVIYDKDSKVDLNNGKAETVAVKAKPAPAASKPVAVSIPGVSPVRTAKCTIEIRATINGVRKRLGFASSQRAKLVAIDAAKANS